MTEIIETNEQGGKNSKVGVRYDLIPAKVLKLLAEVLKEGAEKYAPDNWKLVPSEDHDNHAQNHRGEYLLSHLSADGKEHLGHYLCRVVMFVSQELDKVDNLKADFHTSHDYPPLQGDVPEEERLEIALAQDSSSKDPDEWHTLSMKHLSLCSCCTKDSKKEDVK